MYITIKVRSQRCSVSTAADAPRNRNNNIGSQQSCSQYSVIQVPVQVPVLESQVPVPVPVPMSQVQVQVPVLRFQVPVPVQVLANGT